MAKFGFRFQQILNFRQRSEDDCRRAFFEAQQRLQEALDYLNVMESKYADYCEEMMRRQQGIMTIEELRRGHLYAQQLKKEICWQQDEVERRRIMVEQQQAELQHAVQERKIMERLREKHYAIFCKENEQQEQKLMDELAGKLAGPYGGR